MARRERAGHTRPSLAVASGVSSSRIGELETEACEVRPTTAKALADALDCDIADIVTGLIDLEAEVAAR